MFGIKNTADSIEFQGAAYDMIEEEKIYRPIGAVSINPATVCAFYDHVILIHGNKIRVMETYEEIKTKLNREV